MLTAMMGIELHYCFFVHGEALEVTGRNLAGRLFPRRRRAVYEAAIY